MSMMENTNVHIGATTDLKSLSRTINFTALNRPKTASRKNLPSWRIIRIYRANSEHTIPRQTRTLVDLWTHHWLTNICTLWHSWRFCFLAMYARGQLCKSPAVGEGAVAVLQIRVNILQEKAMREQKMADFNRIFNTWWWKRHRKCGSCWDSTRIVFP